jgi:hypothetical protein
MCGWSRGVGYEEESGLGGTLGGHAWLARGRTLGFTLE